MEDNQMSLQKDIKKLIDYYDNEYDNLMRDGQDTIVDISDITCKLNEILKKKKEKNPKKHKWFWYDSERANDVIGEINNWIKSNNIKILNTECFGSAKGTTVLIFYRERLLKENK